MSVLNPDPICPSCRRSTPEGNRYFSYDRGKNPLFAGYCRDCADLFVPSPKPELKPERTSNRNWNKAHREKMCGYYQKHRMKLKLEVIAAYGGCCACCGESQPQFLSIDHIYGDGQQHRKEMSANRGFRSIAGTGQDLYRWLKRNDFPKDKFQLLCMNCNFAKRNRKECPHKLVIFDAFAWAGACD